MNRIDDLIEQWRDAYSRCVTEFMEYVKQRNAPKPERDAIYARFTAWREAAGAAQREVLTALDAEKAERDVAGLEQAAAGLPRLVN